MCRVDECTTVGGGHPGAVDLRRCRRRRHRGRAAPCLQRWLHELACAPAEIISGALVDDDDTLLAEAHALMARLLPGQP